jgi:hypothetical protein
MHLGLVNSGLRGVKRPQYTVPDIPLRSWWHRQKQLVLLSVLAEACFSTSEQEDDSKSLADYTKQKKRACLLHTNVAF